MLTTLADSWLTRDRDELDGRVGQHALERVLEQSQLAVAADERSGWCRLGVDAEPARSRNGLPGSDRIAFAFQLERGQLLVADCLPCRAIRRLVDDEAADRRRSLQAGGGVDDIAGGDALARARPWRRVGRRPRPSRRRPARRARVLRAPYSSSMASRIRSPARTARSGSSSCVTGRSEDRHHGVADELLHRAAEALDLARDALRGRGAAWRGRPPGRRGRRPP